MTGIDLDQYQAFIREMRGITDPTLRVCRKCGGRFPKLMARMLCERCYRLEPDIHAKRLAYWANYRAIHRDELNARKRAYLAAHRDEINARRRERAAIRRQQEQENQHEHQKNL